MTERMFYPISSNEDERAETMTPSEIRIKSGDTEVVASPDKGALVSVFSVNGENILFEDTDAYNNPNKMKLKGGIPVLFPYAGPREGGIQHGGVREVPVWTWEDSTEDSITFSLDSDNIKNIHLGSMIPGESVGEFHGKDAGEKDIIETLENLYGQGYRFHLELRISVSDKILRYDFKITNLGEKEVPFAPGLHPYFKADHDKRDQIITNLKNFDLMDLQKEGKQTPSANRPESGIVSFVLPDGTAIDINSSPEFRKFVGWAAEKDSDYICIEPFVAHPKDPEGDQIMIKPLETKELFVEFRVL